MFKNFKTYQLALQFHRECEQTKVPSYLRDQLLRASSSVVLNIAEGSGKITPKDRRKFFAIALGSLPSDVSDQLGACLYRLCHPKF